MIVCLLSGTGVSRRCLLLMDWKKLVCAVFLWAGLCLTSLAADTALRPAPEGATSEKSEGGLPSKAPEIGHIGAFPITNSMLVTWLVAIVLIAFAQISMRDAKTIPDGAQNFWEWLVEGLHNFLE